jgi:uncharacterized protein YcfJ
LNLPSENAIQSSFAGRSFGLGQGKKASPSTMANGVGGGLVGNTASLALTEQSENKLTPSFFKKKGVHITMVKSYKTVQIIYR